MSDVEFRTTYTRITDVEGCEGRTIEAVRAWDDDAFGVRFADGTYFFVRAEPGYEAASLAGDAPMDEDRAYRLGVIDGAELARVKAARRAAREAIARAYRDGVDRLAHEQMRRRHGP